VDARQSVSTGRPIRSFSQSVRYWPEDLADEEMLARLLALDLARAG
jgi:hypothetical protein